MRLDLSKLREAFEKSLAKGGKRKAKGERVPAYLRKCKYCKHLELIYCKFHAVTIHPESRACPAFVLKEKFSMEKKEEQTL